MSARFSRIGGALPVLALSALLALSACGTSAPELSGVDIETPDRRVDYVVRLEGMPDEDMAALAEETLPVYRYRDRGAVSFALLQRHAENGLELIEKILVSNGYYDGDADVDVEEISEETFEDEREFEWPSFAALAFWRDDGSDESEEAVPRRYARVTITVDPGKQFTLASHDFRLIDPDSGAELPSPQSVGSPVGGPAKAARIIGAGAAAVRQLQGEGYPYAEQIDRDAMADLELGTLEIETQFFSGPPSVYGPVTFDGLEDVEEAYLRSYIPWQPGEPVSREQIRDFSRDLLATNLFDTASVNLPDDAPEVTHEVALPVTVTTHERPFRTISGGLEYSTDDGPGATGGFEHRNLWGANETLNLRAKAALKLQSFGAGLRLPQYGMPGRDLVSTFVVQHEDTDAFEELRATLTAGFEREFSDEWTFGYGGLVEASRLKENGETRDAYLGGIPTFVAYDGTNDLLNPTEGARARLDLTPFAGTFGGDFVNFFMVDSKTSAYWALDTDRDYVLAARARLGSVISGALDDIPNNHRLYSGGGGSVRGYGTQKIGPLDENGDPEGGRAVAEAGLEMRAKLYGDLGGVVFAGAGTVDRDMFPDFDVVQYAAGVGVRYYSPIGPMRVDVAFPLNARQRDDAFQIYFSIGQAF